MIIRLQSSPVACDAQAGETILLSCARAGIVLSAPCGGRRRCGKCRVRLLEGEVSGDTPDSDGFVRACAAIPVSDIVIAPPDYASPVCPESSVAGGADCVGGARVGEAGILLPAAAKGPARAGVAMDIGTTTISAMLIDLDAALPLETISELNDQRAFGADVMSRIGAARDGRTSEMFQAINRQTERFLARFRERWGLKRIEHLAVSGNTTMQHLFLNANPGGMGELPFTALFLEQREMEGEALSLSAEKVSVLPSISAFIGADISSGLAALDILNSDGASLLIDIGTNGEMALFRRGAILCCSTAAGPCFEGAEISCGMGGVSGAISGVELCGEGTGASGSGENAVRLTTIGNVPPLGICGSGLVDAVAAMLKLGIIDETGFMAGPPSGYFLAPGVSVSNRDVRQFQLAKSAILSGIRILCARGGAELAEIDNVFIAGGFGFYINKANAVAASIFPREFLGRLTVSGNLSLQGAVESLCSVDFGAKCREIISACSVLDLSTDPAFMDEFAENMMF